MCGESTAVCRWHCTEEGLRRLVKECGRICDRRKLKVNVNKSKVKSSMRDARAKR